MSNLERKDVPFYVAVPIESGVARIAAERQRQIEKEGWTPEHDGKHDGGELADAAACYATIGSVHNRGASVDEIREFYTDGMADSILAWPFEDEWFKPSEDPLRNLEKAGALIAAEIDRILLKRRIKSLAHDAAEAMVEQRKEGLNRI